MSATNAAQATNRMNLNAVTLAMRPWRFFRGRASQYSRGVVGRNLSSGLENCKCCGGSAKLTKTATIGGDMLAVEGTDTEEVAKLIMATTELAGRHKASKAAHRSYPSLDPAMVLFQAIIQVGIGSVCNRLAEPGADRLRIRVVAIAGHPIGGSPGHRLRRSKQRLGRGEIAALAQHHIHQGAVSVDRPIEITPAALYLHISLVHVPARRQPAATAPLTELARKDRDELRLPFPDRLVTEHDTADKEHLGQVAQGQPIAQTPEHHESDDVARVLGPVQHPCAAFVELLAAFPAAEPAIALGRALRLLRHSRRTAVQTPHSGFPAPVRRAGTLPAAASARQNSALARSLTEPFLDTTSDFAEIVFAILGVAAKLERRRIKERTAAGRADAKAQGVKFGRKPILTAHQQREARKRIAAGETQRSIARSYNVSQATISRLGP